MNLNLSAESTQRLARIQEDIGAPSDVEVIRRALSVFALLVSEVTSGGEVHLVRHTGEVLLLNAVILNKSETA